MFCDRLAIFLLDGVDRILLGFVENIHSILQDRYVGSSAKVHGEQKWRRTLIVLMSFVTGMTARSLILVLFGRLGDIEESFEEWGYE